MATPELTAKLSALQIKLQNVVPKIKHITEQGRLVATDQTQLFLFKGMYKELKPYFDSFNNLWDNIVELVAQTKQTDVFPSQNDKNLRQNVERYYYEACAVYEHHMNPTPIPQAASSTAGQETRNSNLNESRTVRARLPQINLPTFSGNQVEWPLFRNTYRSLIHDEGSLSDIEKFLFLVSCLKGPALTLIKGIELQEANYAQAWKLLNDTYNDKRRLASCYLKTVLDFVPFKGRPSANGLKHLLTSVGESIDSLKQLKIPNTDDFILFFLVLRCLDTETRRAFEKQYSETEFPTCTKLMEFLRIEWRSLELTSTEIAPSHVKLPTQQNTRQHHVNKGIPFQTSLLTDKHDSVPRSKHPNHSKAPKSHTSSCPVCKANHTLYQCSQFRKASPAEKLASLNGWHGCTNCLSGNHPTNQCNSHRRCQTCAKNHHSWLHAPQLPERPSQPSLIASAISPSGVALGSQCSQGEVLLGTAIIEIQDSKGAYQRIRAVTDSGSQHSFILEECALRIGLPIEPFKQTVSGIGRSTLSGVKGKLNCSIRSVLTNGTKTDFLVEPIVVTHITGDLPHSPVPTTTQSLYKSYVLADEHFWKPHPVEFLLGADLFYEIITGRPITISPESPRLLPTIFGYIIGGPSNHLSASQETSTLLGQSTDDMREVMNKFWTIEEVSTQPIVSKEEKACEQHFLSTHYRLPSGRYVVRLPLKTSISTLTNPRGQALNRLLNLESRLERDESLKLEYHDFMQEYLRLGHMKVAPTGTSFFTIPHHPVLKTQNGQRKLRVVFDASCRTPSGSLNDHMYAGSKLQLDISDVISNFRRHRFVFTADIVKMYRQILVDQSDRQFQHILWRFNPNDNIQEFELCTVTYGEKASAFLAQRTLKQLALDEGASYPKAAAALLEDTYVDDIATGAETITEVIRLSKDLIALLAKGGFQLSKWASNCSELLRTLNEADQKDSCISLSDEENSRVKVLGIQWDPKKDSLSYEICIPPRTPTKRAILSAIARVYDPLGLLAPVIFHAKVIMQEMWIAKVAWDEVGPPEICNKWNLFLDQLKDISKVQLPRCFPSAETAQYNIVGFSDASQRGYAAVIYLQALNADGCQTTLLKAKTKLAPVKPMTIPRLELSGALLLSRLFQSCKMLLEKLNVADIFFFTDSQIVLGWLSISPETLNIFVGHRVVEILETTKRNQWRFVRSEDNPADCSCRGVLPSELISHPLWWNGPTWLSSTPRNWPTFTSDTAVELPDLKQKSGTVLAALETPTLLTWMERFSCYPKMVRSTAYVLRFTAKLQKLTCPTGPISVSEYKGAEALIIRMTQDHYIDLNKQIKHCTAFRSLMPFVDGAGLIRVGGRLQNSQLPHDAKHPYLLPADCHLSKLLVDHYHKVHLHSGTSALHAILRNKFWIIGARNLIRRRVFNCITCYKAMRSPQVPIMGNLPSCRLEEGQVFTHVGVDFAGPFIIRESQRRKAMLGKAYLCLFICMSTKAVHLEVVSKCSTDAFLASFERFTARRGKPIQMYSDCGTNFVGAANRLKDIMLLLRSSDTQKEIAQHTVPSGIKWSFNPPSSPHFGGLWEAGVKSCKAILNKVVGETPLSFEELATLFCRIEGILNSRPLSPQDSDPDGLECLTPGHFLIGRPLTTIPEREIPSNVSILQRWKLIQQKAQHFWTRWRMEYLNLLQQRKKWTKETRNLANGDLVIIKDPNCPQKSWPLARVLETHAGNDGIVRVVTIRTPSGIYKRPVAKLVPLHPINDPDKE